MTPALVIVAVCEAFVKYLPYQIKDLFEEFRKKKNDSRYTLRGSINNVKIIQQQQQKNTKMQCS